MRQITSMNEFNPSKVYYIAHPNTDAWKLLATTKKHEDYIMVNVVNVVNRGAIEDFFLKNPWDLREVSNYVIYEFGDKETNPEYFL